MSVTWEPTKKELNRVLSIIETDYETPRRKKRLADSQHVDWFVTLAWTAAGLLVTVWVRVLYLGVCEAVQFWTRHVR